MALFAHLTKVEKVNYEMEESGSLQARLLQTRVVTRTEGLALIAVLFLVALLTLIAVSVLGVAKTRSKVSGLHAALTQTTEALDSAIRLTLLELSAPRDPGTALIIGGHLERQVDVFKLKVSIDLDLEAGRVDINVADQTMLAAVFVTQGIAASMAQSYAARIVDWRDADDTVTSQGAERSDYQRAGRSYGLRNGPFESVSELRQVLGLENITEEQLDRFTVYSHVPTPIPQTRVKYVRSTLESLRAISTPANLSESDSSWVTPSPERDAGVPVVGQVVRIRACAKTAHPALCRVAVVRFTGSSTSPFIVYAWQSIFFND